MPVRLVVALMLTVPIASGSAAAGLPDFPAGRAWEFLNAQCAFGPRIPGTDAHAKCLVLLEKSLRDAGGDVSLHRFRTKTDASRDSIAMTNLTARFGPPGAPVILGAHWDSRPWADQDPDSSKHATPILGANDGGSGVAVLLTLAEIMKSNPPPIPVEIALFDAEDQGRARNPDGFLLGSREYAGRLLSRPRAVVVLDMVGGQDLHICREGYSEQASGWLNDILFSRARELRLTGFEDRVGYSVLDDHYPFLERGIPAADLIDMDYRQWHTIGDVPRACSPESLGQAGRLLIDVLYGGSLE